jgi:hypothetical protein
MDLSQDEILLILRILEDLRFNELDLEFGALKVRIKRRGSVKGAAAEDE